MILSIIVPFYNSMPYFDFMLKSLISQIEEDIEVVFVDDGSTDGSLDTLKSYNLGDNVKIFSVVNSGVSKARNIGFDYCTGEYVWFVDSDDVIAVSAIKKIKKALNSFNFAPDVITANYYAFDDDLKPKGVIYKSKNFFDEYANNFGMIDDPFDALFSKKTNCSMICNTIFRRENVKNNSVKFDESIVFSEGLVYKFEAVSTAKKFGFMNSYIYGYRNPNVNRGSLSTQMHSIKETICLADALEKWFYYFEKEYKHESGSEFMKMCIAQLINDLFNYIDYQIKQGKCDFDYVAYLDAKANFFEYIKKNINRERSYIKYNF